MRALLERFVANDLLSETSAQALIAKHKGERPRFRTVEPSELVDCFDGLDAAVEILRPELDAAGVAGDSLDAVIEKHRVSQANARKRLQHLVDTLPEADLIRESLVSTFANLDHYIDPHAAIVEVGIGSVPASAGSATSVDYFYQRAEGSPTFEYGMGFSEPQVLAVAGAMLGSERDEVDELVFDTCCELVNIIVGNAFAALSRQGFSLRPAPPRSLGLAAATARLSTALRLEVVSSVGSFDVLMVFS